MAVGRAEYSVLGIRFVSTVVSFAILWVWVSPRTTDLLSTENGVQYLHKSLRCVLCASVVRVRVFWSPDEDELRCEKCGEKL